MGPNRTLFSAAAIASILYAGCTLDEPGDGLDADRAVGDCFEPGLTLAENANRWWREFSSDDDLDSVTVELESGARYPMTYQWGKWSHGDSVDTPAGTRMRLIASGADGVGQTQWFSYLQQSPGAAACQSCSRSRYEAEEVERTTGGRVGGAWNLWSNGSVFTDHGFAGTESHVTVRARGQLGGDEEPEMSLYIDGQRVATRRVGNTSFEEFSFPIPETSGDKEIAIKFENDFFGGDGDDRNLIVDWFEVGCSGDDGGAGDDGADDDGADDDGDDAASNVPGLLDASALVASEPITVTEDGQVIENLHFTASTSQSHIEIAAGVTGVVIRNCKFENASAGHPSWQDGGAVRLGEGSSAVIEHSEFKDNFRAVRAYKAAGVHLLLSRATGYMRNFVELNKCDNALMQNVIAYNVVEWKQGFWPAVDYNGDIARINWAGQGETNLFPEDGISLYSTYGTPDEPTLVLGNHFRTTNQNWDFTGSFGAITTAGDGPLGAAGDYAQIRSNFGWNVTMNGFSINGGVGHTLFDNVVYADGASTALWEDPNDPRTALIRNNPYVYDDWLDNIPSGATTRNNTAYYRDAWEQFQGHHNVTSNEEPHPGGDDPWAYTRQIPMPTWDGVSGGTPQERWTARQATINALVQQFGRFGASG